MKAESVTPEPSGMHVLTVRMTAEQIGELRRAAKARGVSVSEVVRQAVAAELLPRIFFPICTNVAGSAHNTWTITA
jgi:hypothetical protein